MGKKMNIIELSSKKNPVISEVENIKKKPSAGAFVLEGQKFINDTDFALIKSLFIVDLDKYKYITEKLSDNVKVYHVQKYIMQKLCETSSGNDIICIAEKKNPKTDCIKKIIILDNVQDPGNVGTIIRTAKAFDYSVVLTKDCANPFSPKVVRSSAGAVLDTYIDVADDILLYIKTLKDKHYKIYAATIDGNASQIKKSENQCFAVIIGSEGQGISKNILDSADEKMFIMMNNQLNSLNAAVAAGIFMYML